MEPAFLDSHEAGTHAHRFAARAARARNTCALASSTLVKQHAFTERYSNTLQLAHRAFGRLAFAVACGAEVFFKVFFEGIRYIEARSQKEIGRCPKSYLTKKSACNCWRSVAFCC